MYWWSCSPRWSVGYVLHSSAILVRKWVLQFDWNGTCWYQQISPQTNFLWTFHGSARIQTTPNSCKRQQIWNQNASEQKSIMHFKLKARDDQICLVHGSYQERKKSVHYCPTEIMLADYMSKLLQGKVFILFRNVLMGWPHISTLFDIFSSMEKCDESNCCFAIKPENAKRMPKWWKPTHQ